MDAVRTQLADIMDDFGYQLKALVTDIDPSGGQRVDEPHRGPSISTPPSSKRTRTNPPSQGRRGRCWGKHLQEGIAMQRKAIATDSPSLPNWCRATWTT